MIYFSTVQQNIVNAISKKVFWAFEITVSGGGMAFSDEAGMGFDDLGGMEFVDDEVFYWSTVNRSYGGNTYEFKIIPESFEGVRLNRSKQELNLQTPNILEFDILNPNNVYSTSKFKNASLDLKLIISNYTNEKIIRQWKFVVKRVDHKVQRLHFYCEDYIQKYITGDYPNTRLIKDIFPSENSSIDDNVCIPEPYGTAYIPLRSVYISTHNNYSSTTISAIASTQGGRCRLEDSASGFDIFEIGRTVTISGFATTTNNQSAIVLNKSNTKLEFSETQGFSNEAVGQSVSITQGSRTYILGTTAYTFNIEQVRSPRVWGRKSEWDSTDYTFTQSINLNASSSKYRTFQPIIHDVNNDGTADAPGLWQQGEEFLDMPVKFSRSGSTIKTNPADVIQNVLSNMGLSTEYMKINDNLVGYWSFDEGNSTTLFDASGFGNNGVLYGGTSAWSTGKSGNSILFETTLNYALVNNFTKFPTSQITISVWAKFLGIHTGWQHIIENSWLAGSGTWIMAGTTLGICFGVASISTSTSLNQNMAYSTADIIDGNWHNIIGRYDGNYIRIFVDTTMGSTAHASTVVQTSLYTGTNLHIGTLGDEYTYGYLDELRIYDKALSSTEIEELYYNYSMKGWWENARNTYYMQNIDLNFAFWYKESREKKLSTLLNMCHSCLLLNDKIELVPLKKTSVATIDRPNILTEGSENEESTFDYNFVNEIYSDCGYIAWQQSGESQDKFLQILVPSKNSKTVISNEVMEIPAIQDSQIAQKLGILFYQRKLLKESEVTFRCKSNKLELQPNDVITIDNTYYGGTYDVLVESIFIRKDISIEITCVKFSEDLDDFEDLSPSAIVVYIDDPNAKIWEPVIAGPLTEKNMGQIFQVWARPFLLVAPHANKGDYTSIQSAINALSDKSYEGIYILNGTYDSTSPIYLPDRNIAIIGESKGGVIVRPPIGQNGFVLHNLTKTFSFSKFTITSLNTTAFTNMIYVYGDASSDNDSDVTIDDININLSNATTNWNGDCGLNFYKGKNNCTVRNVKIDNGNSGINIYSYNKINILNNILNRSKYRGIYVESSTATENVKNLSISGNKILNFGISGIHLWGSSQTTYSNYLDVSLNQLRINSSDNIGGSGIYSGIFVYKTYNLRVIGNNVTMYSSRMPSTGWNISVNGISVGRTNQSIISNNTVDINARSSGKVAACNGISSLYCNDNQFSNNCIKIDCTSTGGGGLVDQYVQGLYLRYSDRNILQGNNIDLTNNRALETGIKLDTGADNNQGGDNITYHCGVSISDSGSSNDVTAKDI